MKKLLLALACLMLVSCAGEKDVVRKSELKKETPLWSIISTSRASNGEIDYKDKWFRYNVSLNYVRDDGEAPSSGFMTSCPVSGAVFTVYDRKTGSVVRTERLKQRPCATCHKR